VPVTTQLKPVRRARPTPIETTTYAAKSVAPSASGATTRWPSQKSLFLGARICTSHGASNPSPVAIHAFSATRYVSTKPYVRRATRSSAIE